MHYVSTRGQAAPLSFSDVLLEGLASDGGLRIPDHLPQIDSATLAHWRTLSYADLAFEILRRFATDIEPQDLQRIVHAAYQEQVFGTPMVPCKPLSNGVTLLGLSEGPTLAFKDMAMQLLGHLFEYVLQRKNRVINIVGATSGDTGSAAEYALRGKKGVQVFMLSPYGRMSDFQRAQMYSLLDDNIFNIAIKGVFDDCQDIVKALNGDLAFRQRYHLGVVNSINWGRIAAQIVYYFWGYLRLTSHNDQLVSFCVPSGNFGNILAGHLARQMGLPIHRLVLASNENNVLEEFFRTGIYRPRDAAHTYATSSPSMDISKASNFERFVYDLVGKDGDTVQHLWHQLSTTGAFDLTAYLPQLCDTYGFEAGASSHAQRLATIREVWAHSQYILDPHTADGVCVALQHRTPDIPMIVLETALPAKFSPTIEEALGQAAPIPEKLQGLESLPQRVTVLDNDTQQVRAFLEQHI